MYHQCCLFSCISITPEIKEIENQRGDEVVCSSETSPVSPSGDSCFFCAAVVFSVLLGKLQLNFWQAAEAVDRVIGGMSGYLSPHCHGCRFCLHSRFWQMCNSISLSKFCCQHKDSAVPGYFGCNKVMKGLCITDSSSPIDP